MKKLLCMLMSAMLMFSVVACTPKPDGPSGNSNQSELNVAIVDSGLGTAFAEEIEKDFEAYYADYEFEPGSGKKGVDVVLHPGLEEYNPGTLDASIDTLETTVYILDRVDYHALKAQDVLVDISDTVKEKIYDKDGNMAADTSLDAVFSIEDLMVDGADKFARFDAADTDKDGDYYDGNYYGVPYYANVGGIIYDADLFDEKYLFFDASGRVGANKQDIADGNCSTGPDGKLGTFDDGMPNTMKDFEILLKEMRDTGIIPFSFSGQYWYTRNNAYQAIHASYEGRDDYMLNFSFDGTDSDPNIGEITNEKSSYVKLLNQEGRKAGIRFFQEIAADNRNYVKGSTDSTDQLTAQYNFITSVNSNTRVAFLIEGGWWESESRETFDTMATNPEHAYGKRDFRLFPIPDFIGSEADGVKDQTNQTSTILANATGKSHIFLSKKNTAENPEVAEQIGRKFIQFIHQREQIIKFTKNTGGCVRMVRVPTDYTEEEIATLTKYGQSIYRYINDGADLVYNVPTAKARIETMAGYTSAFGSGDEGWGFACAVSGGVNCGDPLSVFVKEKDTGLLGYSGAGAVNKVFEHMKARIESTYAG